MTSWFLSPSQSVFFIFLNDDVNDDNSDDDVDDVDDDNGDDDEAFWNSVAVEHKEQKSYQRTEIYQLHSMTTTSCSDKEFGDILTC